jgi:hypothetical protein
MASCVAYCFARIRLMALQVRENQKSIVLYSSHHEADNLGSKAFFLIEVAIE